MYLTAMEPSGSVGFAAVALRESIAKVYEHTRGKTLRRGKQNQSVGPGKKIFAPGTDSWIVDTGSGNRLLPRSAMSKHEKDNESKGTPLNLAIANGSTTSLAITDIETCSGTESRRTNCRSSLRTMPK